jgi:hypothetical protein
MFGVKRRGKNPFGEESQSFYAENNIKSNKRL